MARARKFVPVREIIGTGPIRSRLENMGQEGEVVKIDKKPYLSYTEQDKVYATYSVIAEKNGAIIPLGFAIALVMKIKNAINGRTIRYKIIPLRGINTETLLNQL